MAAPDSPGGVAPGGPAGSGRGRRRRAATVTAVVLGVVGVTAVGCGLTGGSTPEPPRPPAAVNASPDSSPTSSASAVGEPAPTGTPLGTPVPTGSPAPSGADAEPEVPPLPPSEPVSVRLPSIDVRSDVVDLGLNPDDTMETPSDPADTGWYTGSPTPGSLGPAVLAGHVTWNGDESVFFRLGDLRPGDPVEVTRADGRTAVFRVTRVEEYPKDQFPTVEVYSNTKHSALRLITCAGEFDEDRRYYDANLVAYADLVDVKA